MARHSPKRVFLTNRLGVVNGPSSEAVEESIRGRRCAPRIGGWAKLGSAGLLSALLPAAGRVLSKPDVHRLDVMTTPCTGA
jgi:hypothetical protein